MLNPTTELASSNHVDTFNPTRQKNDSYDNWEAIGFGEKARKTAKNYEDYRNFSGGGVQFRADYMEDESGVCSPPLWTTSPLPPRHPQNDYHSLSPNSRDQEIARGQWELMEMVKNMPESSYELSLRDLVQQKSKMEAQEECLLEEKIFDNGFVNQRVKVMRQESKSEWKEKMRGSGSTDHHKGLFLKIVFPVSLGSMKKKNLAKKPCARVSPNHKAPDKSPKGVDKEWWKKKISFSGESEAGGRNSSPGSSGSRSCSSNRSKGRRKKSVFLHGCCFCHTKKSICKVENL